MTLRFNCACHGTMDNPMAPKAKDRQITMTYCRRHRGLADLEPWEGFTFLCLGGRRVGDQWEAA